MKKEEIVTSFGQLEKDLIQVAKNLAIVLSNELGLKVKYERTVLGHAELIIDNKENNINKRCFIHVYATGMVIFDCQNKLTTEEKTSLDTSVDYLEPDLTYQNEKENHTNLGYYKGMNILIMDLKKFFES